MFKAQFSIFEGEVATRVRNKAKRSLWKGKVGRYKRWSGSQDVSSGTRNKEVIRFP